MKKFLMIAVTMLVSVSCLNGFKSDDSYTSEFVGVMTTVNTSTQSSYEDAATIRIIQEKLTVPEVDIELNGVRFVSPMPEVNFTLKDLAFSIYTSDDENDPLLGYYKISYMSVIPYVGDVPREDYTMHNFIAYIGDRTINIDFDVNFGGQVYHAAFRLDEEKEEEAYWSQSYMANMQVVGGGSTYTNDAMVYVEQWSKSKPQLTIELYYVKFSSMMPETKFTMLNIPFYTIDGSEARIVEVETVVPIDVNGNPNAEYAMDNVRGRFEDALLSLSFDVVLGGTTYKVSFGAAKTIK